MSQRGFRLLAHVSGRRRYVLGSDLVSSSSSGAVTPTFHILTEGGDSLLTEAGDFLDIEHV